MIENKLIHYETRNAFEAEKPNIGDTSVAFISEDRTIYTHGVEYNCAEALQRASDIDREIRDLIDQKNQEIIDAINQLTRETEEQAEQNRQEAIRRLQEAEAALEEIRNRLSQMTEDQGDAGQEIDKINGRIAQFAEWWNTADQTFTNIQQTLDAHEGLISTVGEHYNTLNGELNTYKNEVNLKLGQLTQELEHIDVTETVRTVIGTEIDAPNGLFKQFAKTSQIIDDSDVQQWVEQKFNSLDPSWETLVNKVITNENDISKNTTAITGIKADISSQDAILREFSSWKQGATESIAALELKSSSDGSSYTLTATKIYDALNGDSTNGKRVAATIMGWVNDEGSGITLNANKINFDADTLRFISDNIVIDGSKIELPDDFTVDGSKIHIPAANVDGLNSLVASQIAATSITASSLIASSYPSTVTINGNGITIKPNSSTTSVSLNKDGSGSLAKGNITWNTSGAVTMTNATVSGDIVAKSVNATYGSSSVKLDSNGLVIKPSSSTTSVSLNRDGSGYVANNNVSWDASGNVTIKGATLNGGTIDNYWTKTQVDSAINTAIENAQFNTGGDGMDADDVRQIVTTYINNQKGTANGLFSDFVTTTDSRLKESTIKGYFTKEYLTTTVGLADGTLVSTLNSGLTKLNGALLDSNGNVKEYVTASQLSSSVTNALTNDTTLAGLKTWARGNAVGSSAGFSLGALVKNVAGQTVNGGDLIVGEINNAGSSVKINANKVNITASNLGIKASDITFSSSDSDTVYAKFTAMQTEINNIKAGSVTAKTLRATSGSSFVDITSGGITVDPGRAGYYGANIASDGSGYLANKNISWTTSGTITLKNATITGDSSLGANITIPAGQVTGLSALVAEQVQANTVAATEIVATSGGSTVTVNSSGITVKPSGSSTAIKMNKDGSGFVANGNISWNSSGDVTIKGTVIDWSTVNPPSSVFKIECTARAMSYSQTMDDLGILIFITRVYKDGNYVSNGGSYVIDGSHPSVMYYTGDPLKLLYAAKGFLQDYSFDTQLKDMLANNTSIKQQIVYQIQDLGIGSNDTVICTFNGVTVSGNAFSYYLNKDQYYSGENFATTKSELQAYLNSVLTPYETGATVTGTGASLT